MHSRSKYSQPNISTLMHILLEAPQELYKRIAAVIWGSKHSILEISRSGA
jgi:hypothetical protein